MKPAGLVLLGVVLLGLVLRLAFALGYWTGQPLTRDEREYLSLARGLAAGRGLTYDADVLATDPDPFGRAPGYPAFLAMVGGGRAVTAGVPASVKIAQSVVGAAGVWLIGLLAARVAGPRAGVAATCIAAIYPPLVWIAVYGYSEALAWPLGIAVVLLFDRAVESRADRGRMNGWLCGAVTGLTILVRPATIFFLVLAGIWLLWRRGLPLAAVFLFGAACLVGPWTLRQIAHDGRPVLIASEGGVTFWTGNHPLAIGEGDFAANPDLKRASTQLRAEHPGLNEQQMEPVYYREAFAWIGAHPGRWLVLEARKTFYLIVPIGPSYRLHSARYYAASLVLYGLLLPAALVGFWSLGSDRWRTPGLWLMTAGAVGACIVFFPQERFRIPVIDPALIVCAAALWTSRSALTRRSNGNSPLEVT